MEKTIAYERKGKFGNEYLIPMNCLSRLPNKDTEKAYAFGDYYNGKAYVYAWVAKKLTVEINGAG